MLNDNDRDFFQQNGYVIVRNVFAPDDLRTARQRIETLFASSVYRRAPHSNAHIINDLYRFAPELLGLVFNEKYFAAVRVLLGDRAAWIPECAVHRERFFGWHKDSTGAEHAGMNHHYRYPWPLLTGAVYLQDNGPAGGGLTVAAGTHREPDHLQGYYRPPIHRRIHHKVLKWLGRSEFDRLERHPGKLDLPSRLGDLVLFDIRLTHRATQPREKATQAKLAIFNSFVRADGVGENFLQYQKRRPEPHFRYFRRIPPPDCVYERAAELRMHLMY